MSEKKEPQVQPPQEVTSLPIDSIIETRKGKLEVLRSQNIDPYPARCEVKDTVTELRQKYVNLKPGESLEQDSVILAGRLITIREMGKSTFAHLQDSTGRIQIYLRTQAIGAELFANFKKLYDSGDIIGITGVPFVTRTGELTIDVRKFGMLSKALRPLPEKWHGLKDPELRYRQRYLDLLTNETTAKILRDRALVIKRIRGLLDGKGFMEVETPMMQPIPGGATARPFVTHHNALDIDLYLRIAPELYLKRLIVGGYDKVYELNRNFRNEGISTKHNPEFTMLELYQAYSDLYGMMDITEEIICVTAQGYANENNELEFCGNKINITRPWKRETYFGLLQAATGEDVYAYVMDGKTKELARNLSLDIDVNKTPEHKIIDNIFEKKVQPGLINPTFVTDFATKWTPLAKSKPDNPNLVERFELFVGGEEVANAYSELNDPIEQRNRLLAQAKDKAEGDAEAMFFDDDFIIALEHGMPPCGGLGIGIDRLIMILTNTSSIRETIAFPLMRPEKK
ncbi:MAG: lysine--tRNA ligase [Elusimicrobiota bacterium]